MLAGLGAGHRSGGRGGTGEEALAKIELKAEAPEVIVTAVHVGGTPPAARGEGYFSPPVAAKIAGWARREGFGFAECGCYS